MILAAVVLVVVVTVVVLLVVVGEGVVVVEEVEGSSSRSNSNGSRCRDCYAGCRRTWCCRSTHSFLLVDTPLGHCVPHLVMFGCQDTSCFQWRPKSCLGVLLSPVAEEEE